MEGLIEGRIVHYVLTSSDVNEINRRRVAKPHDEGWPAGAQAHVGNQPIPGDHCPMVIVRVWNQDIGTVNGQVLLDGNDVLWVTSVVPGDSFGNWHWIERS